MLACNIGEALRAGPGGDWFLRGHGDGSAWPVSVCRYAGHRGRPEPAGQLVHKLGISDGRDGAVPDSVRILATNPPFNQHSAFIQRALHLLDANVALGELVDIVGTQGKQYLKKH